MNIKQITVLVVDTHADSVQPLQMLYNIEGYDPVALYAEMMEIAPEGIKAFAQTGCEIFLSKPEYGSESLTKGFIDMLVIASGLVDSPSPFAVATVLDGEVYTLSFDNFLEYQKCRNEGKSHSGHGDYLSFVR